MSQFTRVTVSDSEFDGIPAIRIQKLLSLISASEFKDKVIEHLKVAGHEEEYVAISGASTLFNRVEEVKRRYVKFDVLTTFDQVNFKLAAAGENQHDRSLFRISFDGHEALKFPDNDDANVQQAILDDLDKTGEPIYESQNQFFSKVFKFNIYANSLLNTSNPVCVSIVDTNLKLLKSYYSGVNASKPANKKLVKHRYRMLREVSTGKYFFRAMISRQYQDYNIGMSVFVALLSLHHAAKEHQKIYMIREFSYTESTISVIFENTKGIIDQRLGEVRFQVLLTNNETTKGAVKLSGMFAIMVKVDGKIVPLEASQQQRNQKKYSDKILSISHAHKPETAIAAMNTVTLLKTVEEQLFKEVSEIGTAKTSEQLKNLFKERLDNSRSLISSEATHKQLEILFKQQANSFLGLLEIMGKAQLIIEQDGAEAKEVLRYIVHSVLFDTEAPSDNLEEDGDNE
jgi:hypothetical protein